MTFESVDYGDEDEATAPEPATASAVAPMSDERLAEIRVGYAAYLRRAQRLGLGRAVGGIGELLAERDAAVERAEKAERELAEVRERIGAPTPAGYEYRANGPLIHKITEDDVSRYPDEWVDDYLPERRPLYAGAWERLDGAEWKAADGG